MASRQDVIAQLYPKIVAATQGTGIDPRIVMAQFLQETGGNLNAPGHNIFNITAGKSWQGPSIYRGDTNKAGQKIQQQFRSYGSIDEAVADYVKFVTQNPRYAGTLSGTLEERAAALGSSGYAEDPTYGQKVLALARGLPGGTGAAYPTLTQNANNIPGGYIPSELPAGGLNAPLGATTARPSGAVEIPGFSAEWMKRLEGVNPKMLQIIAKAAQDNPGLFAPGVEGGRRDLETQKKLLAKGVTKTLKSYHVAGNATDLWPINPKTGKPDPNYIEGYGAVSAAMKKAAADLGVTNLGWGGDWKGAWDKPHYELKGENPYEATGGTGAAYPQRTGANGIPGGYTPSELPAGGIPGSPGPPQGVLGPAGREPPAPAQTAPSAPLAPFFAAPNTDAARMLSDPSRYGLSSEQYAELRRQMEAGGPGGGTIGNIPAPQPAPPTPSAPPPAGVLSTGGAPPAPGAPPPSPWKGFEELFKGLPNFDHTWRPGAPAPAHPAPTLDETLAQPGAERLTQQAAPAPGGQGAATQLLDDWRNKRPLGLFQGGWT